MVWSFATTVRSEVLPFSLHLKVRLVDLSGLTVLSTMSNPTVRETFFAGATTLMLLLVSAAITGIAAAARSNIISNKTLGLGKQVFNLIRSDTRWERQFQ